MYMCHSKVMGWESRWPCMHVPTPDFPAVQLPSVGNTAPMPLPPPMWCTMSAGVGWGGVNAGLHLSQYFWQRTAGGQSGCRRLDEEARVVPSTQ
jgi:hypothetical protein